MVRWLIVAVLVAGCTTANAQPDLACGDRELTLKELKDTYGEVIRFRGYSSKWKVMVEVLSSASGSWTLLLTSPDKPDTVCRADFGQAGDLPPAQKLGIRISEVE